MQQHNTSYEPTTQPKIGKQHGPHPLTKLRREPVLVIGPSIAYIPLTQGQYALIDRDDVRTFGRFNWYAQWNPGTQSFYAMRDAPGRRKVQMHVAVLNPEEGFLTDHINGNTLDNRGHNLRQADKSQNSMNARLRRDNASGYRGVTKSHGCDRWTAHITVNRKRLYLGSHATPEDAHATYCAAAAELHGEYRRLA